MYCVDCGATQAVCDLKIEEGYLACCPACYVFDECHRFMDAGLVCTLQELVDKPDVVD